MEDKNQEIIKELKQMEENALKGPDNDLKDRILKAIRAKLRLFEKDKNVEK